MHLVNYAHDVVANQLGQHFVFHRHVALAPHAVPKLPLDADAWRESPLMTGASLRLLIPLADGMAALAREIQELKSRLPPAEKANGKGKRK